MSKPIELIDGETYFLKADFGYSVSIVKKTKHGWYFGDIEILSSDKLVLAKAAMFSVEMFEALKKLKDQSIEMGAELFGLHSELDLMDATAITEASNLITKIEEAMK